MAKVVAKVVARFIVIAVVAAAVLSLQMADAAAATSSPTQAGLPIGNSSANEQKLSQFAPKDEANASAPRAKERSLPRFLGATLDLGFPDGAIVGVVGRPSNWLRLAAGAGTNSVSPGVRGGITLIPLGSGPSLTLEAGHYFNGNANGTVSAFAGSSYQGSRLADKVGYQFANLHLGMELGKERFTFFFHGGMSYVHSVLYGANNELGGQTQNADGGSTTVVINGDPVITAWMPSFKLGFIFYVV
jgi:hypothetical protein